MLFMVIEKYRDGDAKPVYRRFNEKGRMCPHGARYLSSWVTTDFERCFQVMDCDDRMLLDEWMQNNDAKAKKATLETLVSDVISTRG